MMSINKVAAVAIATLFWCILSCQKEYSFENDMSEGILKDDATGTCLPFTINGLYKEDSLLDTSNYIDVQVDVLLAGTYIINSDTVNGFSFNGAGRFQDTGLHHVRLFASGRPIDPGISAFIMKYDSSACTFEVLVMGPGAYTLGGTGDSCTGVTVGGIYAADLLMTSANTVKIDVDVSVLGTYSISTNAANGVTFSKSGTFTTLGPQQIILTASGTPADIGTIEYTVNSTSGSCSFPITYLPGAAQAEYTTVSDPNSSGAIMCTGATFQGVYTTGIPLNASNTITIKVNVTKTGAYQINTVRGLGQIENGYRFSVSGWFANTGIQNVVLSGSGTPIAPGLNEFTAIPPTMFTGCSFWVTVL